MFAAALAIALMILSLMGWGWLCSVAIFGRKKALSSIWTLGLLGVFPIILIGITVNLFLPLSEAYSLTIYALGISLVIFARKAFKKLDMLSLIFLPGILIAIFGSLKGDAAYYHMPVTQSIRDFPVILGIGNLHFRYAFNSAWPVFSASLWNPLLKEVSILVVNASVAFLTLGFLLDTTLKSKVSQSRWLSLVLLGSLVTIVSGVIVTNANRITNDIPPLFLTLAGFIYLTTGLYGKREEAQKVLGNAIIMFAAAILIKFTHIANIGLILVCLLLSKKIIGTIPFKAALIAFFSGLLLAGRGFLQSGCLAYPAAATCLKTNWSPGFSAEQAGGLITQWARTRVESVDYSLLNLSWLREWFSLYSDSLIFIGSVGLIIVGVCAILGTVRARRAKALSCPRFLLPLVIVIAAIVLWLLRMPDPRFGMTYLILAGAFALSFSLSIWKPNLPRNLSLYPIAFSALALLVIAVKLRNPDLGAEKWVYFETPATTNYLGLKDLPIKVSQSPTRDCWLTPFPCVPSKPSQDLLWKKVGLWHMFYFDKSQHASTEIKGPKG
ncbi:MAG: hypothetical protein HRU19_19480 [Pseudobacteriovorax sp.]|nr:hypothetical protein [Pseudobacteriovorax sp.]